MTPRAVFSALLVVVALLSAACGRGGPRAVVAGEDACQFCHMVISDPRFGSQVLTSTGKAHVFDSVECLVGYLSSSSTSADAVWVTDAESAGSWVAATEAGYLIDAKIHSPMGRIAAFASPAAATAAQARLGGATVSWTAVRSDSAGITAHSHTSAHGGH